MMPPRRLLYPRRHPSAGTIYFSFFRNCVDVNDFHCSYGFECTCSQRTQSSGSVVTGRVGALYRMFYGQRFPQTYWQQDMHSSRYQARDDVYRPRWTKWCTLSDMQVICVRCEGRLLSLHLAIRSTRDRMMPTLSGIVWTMFVLTACLQK